MNLRRRCRLAKSLAQPATTVPQRPIPPGNLVTNVVDPLTGVIVENTQLVKGPDQAQWIHSCVNEVGRLAIFSH
jgi:hypothetical protein